MTEPLRAISADDSALCLLKAVQLGHVEVALQLLQSGIQLSRRLEKEDLEADAPSEVESVWEFHRGVWRWRSWEHDLVSKRSSLGSIACLARHVPHKVGRRPYDATSIGHRPPSGGGCCLLRARRPRDLPRGRIRA